MEIRLLGQRIPLKTSHPDSESAREVVTLVSDLIASAEQRSKKGTAAHQIVLLALLELAEDHVRARHSVDVHQKEFAEKAGELVSILEGSGSSGSA